MGNFKANPQLISIIKQAAQKGLMAVAVGLQREIKRTLNRSSSQRGATPSAPGQPPAKDTGTLGRSIQIDATNPEKLRVGTNLVYAKIQEFGGTIRPKKVKMIPVPVNQRARDLMRKYPGGLRDIPNLSRIESAGGIYIIEKLQKKRGKQVREVIGAVWHLRNSVRLAARPYMRPSLQAYAPKAGQDFARAFRAAMRRGT